MSYKQFLLSAAIVGPGHGSQHGSIRLHRRSTIGRGKMKKHVSLLIAACIAVLLLLPACQQPNKTTSLASLATPATGATHITGSRIGNKAPDFSLLDTDGRTVKLSSLLGRPVFINFWSIE
jgi:cytochrome oxidase Cu insertion factor (SCO1/SenC/PrrC family)